jgi:hypothetical protein
VKRQNEPPASVWETAIGQLAEQAASSRDVGLAHLDSHVRACAEIARSCGDTDLGPRLAEVLAAIRKDVDARLARVEAAVLSEQY